MAPSIIAKHVSVTLRFPANMATATTAEASDITTLESAFDSRHLRSEATPAWWNERRAHAREVFAQTAWPRERDEKWRYSLVEKIDFASFDYSRPERSHHAGASLLKPEDRAGVIVFDNGHVVRVDLREDLRAKGVYFATLEQAVLEQADLLRSTFMTDLVKPEYGKFAAFHGALTDSGGVLIVPEGVEVDQPFEVHHTLAGKNVTLFPHFLVVAERGSKFSFVNSYASASPEDGGLVVAAMELFVREKAQVSFITVNEWSEKVNHFEIQRHMADKGAEVKNLVLTLGSGFTRMNVEAKLGGERARSEMLGLWVGNNRQKFDHRTLQEHAVGQCFSDVLYKGVLLDRARSVYSGLINVYPDAQKTDAYQTNRNMVLGGKGRADTIPMLEIEANDVKCSHGATVGQVEFEHLFYLMSRGVPKLEAEKLIVFGFFEEVLNRLPIAVVSDTLRDRIGRNLMGVDYEQLSAARRLLKGGAAKKP